MSPLLEGLDEAAPRSRAQAYWRRAQMSLRIASIADFCRRWQAAAREKLVSTPKPGHVGRVAQVALGGGATPAKPPSAEVEAERALAPQLAALRRRVDDGVRVAVAVAVLAAELRTEGGGRSSLEPPPEAELAAAASAAAAAATEAESEPPTAPGHLPDPDAARRVWARAAAEARAAAPSGAAYRQASQQAPAWAAAVRAAAHSVVELNMPPLTEHLRTILHDNCASAVRSSRPAAPTRRPRRRRRRKRRR